ncbi:hypothetical protein B0J11DRAFT_20568 [Dendryphion nanum]|uniref:Secreted protein n=1 Tax=Dendryphion nanum TaxID=256645 RepID=A0A9P9EK56_9PLEO|nr:hypothetical protein B0J11DRAFT_20568 [Dendryphion nanum]
MKYTFTALALAAVALATPIPESDFAPPSFKIADVISGGSGCPQGSIDVDFTDSSVLPIYFGKDFIASVGNGVGADQSRKNCQLNLKIQYSKGWQYTVIRAEYQGWGRLDPGVKGRVNAQYYFSGETNSVSTPIYIDGPFNGRWKKDDSVFTSFGYSSCDGEALLNVNSDVALTPLGKAVSGTLAQTKENVKLGQSIWFQWRKC